MNKVLKDVEYVKRGKGNISWNYEIRSSQRKSKMMWRVMNDC